VIITKGYTSRGTRADRSLIRRSLAATCRRPFAIRSRESSAGRRTHIRAKTGDWFGAEGRRLSEGECEVVGWGKDARIVPADDEGATISHGGEPRERRIIARR
jgi:hypothetical protein